MSDLLNLDTHILLFALQGKLRPAERELLTRHRWGISSIVKWEIAKLAQLGRIEIDLDDRELERTFTLLHEWSLSWDVVRTSTRLDFRSDPADEIIAATSVVHQVPLLTRDHRILASERVPLEITT